MNKKIIIAVVALVAAGGAYKTVLAKPKAKAKKPNVEGTLYVMQKEFLVNLADERYAKISAALLLNPKDHSTAAAGGHGAPTPPEGYGAMTQEAVIRSIITDVFTGLPADDLEDTQEAREAPQGDPAPDPRGVRRPRRRYPVPRPDGPVGHEREHHRSRRLRPLRGHRRPPTPGPAVASGDLARLHDVPVELAVEIGRTRMTIGETLALGPGSIVTLDRLAGEPVDLLVNGKPIARGEVVVIDEEFGLRVTEVVCGAPARDPDPTGE